MNTSFIKLGLALAVVMLTGCSTSNTKILFEKRPEGAAPIAQRQKSVILPAQVEPKPIVAAALPSVLALTSTTTDRQFKSLQPFKKFKKGEGQGVAREYVPRSKGAIVKLFRDKERAKRELRVTCEVLVQQMAEIHNLPFEGCEGAVAAMKSKDFKVVPCKDSFFAGTNALAVTDPHGKTWGTWNRSCYKGERVLTYKGKPILSTTCMNVVVPQSAAIPTMTASVQKDSEAGDCAEIHFPTRRESRVTIAFMGDQDAIADEKACLARNNWNWADGSENKAHFSKAEEVLRKKLVLIKAFSTPASGNYTLYVPREFLNSSVLSCLVPERGAPMPTGFAGSPYDPKQAIAYNNGVMRWMRESYADFLCVDAPSYSSQGVAKVYYSQKEVPPETRHPLYYPDMGTSLFY